MILQDLKFSVRSLAKAPGMTVTALLALALGIGVNTALFSVVDAVLLRPLQYPHPERIVELMRSFPKARIWSTTATKFSFWERENHSFEAMAAYSFLPLGLNLTGTAETHRLAALPATAGFFSALGVQPVIGRSYTAEEAKPGAGHYAVLSYGLWQRAFHGDPHLAGQHLNLSNAAYAVIGVMPRGFDTPQHPDLWVPLVLTLNPGDKANDYAVIARLKPGVTLTMAQADLKLVGERFRQAYGADFMDRRESIVAMNVHDFLVGDARQPLWILLAAVGLVLLVACANVANLLLTRSLARQREMAVRLAIGASAWQLVRQLMTESLVLALAGTALGWLVAAVSLPFLVRLAPAAIPQLSEASLDLRVFTYTLGVALLTGVLFGLFPAAQSARLGIGNPLREAGARVTGSAASRRIRQSLVIGEVAISLMLLIGAALLVQTMRNLQRVRPGFESNHVLAIETSLDRRYLTRTALAQLHSRITERLRMIPGVVEVGSTDLPPMTPYMDLPFDVISHPAKHDEMQDELYRMVGPHYFHTLEVPIAAGREFDERDTPQSQPVAVINQPFAEKYFPHQSALGQQILVGRAMGPAFADKPRRIVGVVGAIHDSGLDRPAPPEMFEPMAQTPDSLIRMNLGLLPVNWMVRTTGDPMAIAGRVRREMLVATGDIPVADARPLVSVVEGSLARQRFLMGLLSVFAGLALLLGTVGLYGVISYSVAQRTRELGIRSALGAARADLLRLVVNGGMRLTAAGLLCGLVGALALTRFLQNVLYGISSSDPLLLGAVTMLMTLVALSACLVPAYRASRVDPLTVLRDE